jgi:hypothetical protein
MEIDQFMKEVAGDFLTEIMELFFLHFAQHCDFSQKKDLSKDFYTQSPKGEERFVDVLMEVSYKNPPPEVLLIHIESEVLLIHIESQQQKRFDFQARMLGYHCLIYAREIEKERRDSFTVAEFNEWVNRKRILSFVFCNYTLGSGITQEECEVGILETQVGCRYTCISLPLLSAMEYLQKDNPVVCALAVFMNPNGLSKPTLKVECYRKLLSYMQNLTDRQINQIMYALETYLILTEEENQIYGRLIREVYPEVSEMITNPLIEQGRRQGEEIGRRALQQSIVKFLSYRFQQIPEDLQKKISSLNDIQKLQNLLDASLEVDSLEELASDGFFDE